MLAITRNTHPVVGRDINKACLTLLLGKRRYSGQYQYNNPYPQYNPRPSWTKRLFYTSVGLLVVFAYAYYMYWPKHTFPSSVAKILRKGLLAESDKGENDYQLALKYYLEAIKHCNEIGMDNLSDEYTGIQLKVAEMFERLDMIEDAAFVYNEIATLYLKVLTAKPDSLDGKRVKNSEHRAHLIQKDLRIAIKLVEMNGSNPQLAKAILMTHLIIAQDEVQKKLGPFGSLKAITQPMTAKDGTSTDYKATIDQTSIEISSNGVVTTMNKNPSAWEPFSDEFFNAMDLLTALCISTGDLNMASRVKISMTEWMLLADVEPHKILLSQCNLASLLYLQAEQYEAQEIALRRKFSDLTGIEYSRIKNETSLNQNKEIINELLEKVPESDKESYDLAVLNKDKCINLSIKSYESVLEFAKNLPQNTSTNSTVSETVALATYGLGVVQLHLTNYEKAERLLRESRVRSKSCGYDDLIAEIERELSKLFKEKKLSETSKSARDEELENADIEMDIHMKR
ncbi:uncharacterized protein PRCAT00002903001 [Priceomyces carsonii]|uniref:uncharacterized protein n=1 Tax=Priceomyces carsonii TaxID=28549 RepID=UPI002ED92AB6|nr:unnamed protein product [Priceomyces carsonii]